MTDQPSPPVSSDYQPQLKPERAIEKRARKSIVSRGRVLVTLAVVVLGVLIVATIVVFNNRNQPLAPSSTNAVSASATQLTSVLPKVETLTVTPRPTVAATSTVTPTRTAVPKVATSPTLPPPFEGEPEVIGTSVQGRPLVVYRLGTGPIKRALIGAIHGGYEWNTVDLMTETLKYLRDEPALIPPDLTLYILPIANPDGYAAGTDRVTGRLNSNRVDLNRNWDYQWQITATHGTNPVSAGTAPFSEPETVAMRNFIMSRQVEAVVFYHSAFTAVFQGAGITTSKTIELAKLIAVQTGYRYAPEGVPGQITTGDSIDWLTVEGITAIEVELTTHQTLDWEQNRRGLLAFLNWNLPQVAGVTPLASPDLTPGASPVIEPPSGQRIHVVVSGDTLSGIAAQYDVSIDDLLKANGLKIDVILQIDQKIIIPGP